MVKAVVLCMLILSSRAGLLGADPGPLVFTGVSGRMRSAEQEIESALDDAALQLALYHGLTGKAVTVLGTGAGYRDFYLAIDADIRPLDEGAFAAYREALRFDREKDLLRTAGAVYLRCTYEDGAAGFLPVPGAYGMEGREPAWIRGGPVEIPGGISAVGFAKNRRYLKETILKSRESAAVALLARVSSRIETAVADQANRAAAVTTVEIIEGELLNFMVLEVWIDPADSSVWTLAAARKM